MSPFSPEPRFRLYRARGSYAAVALSTLAGAARRAGAPLAELEQQICERTGSPHAVCLSQGRTGIYLALRGLIEPGQAVVLSPYTFHDVINMVLCAGGRPVFADVESNTCNISADEVRRLVDETTGAVIATHLHGITCNIESIAAICRERGVPLIEDAAQSFGARISGRPAGTFGDVGIFSFSRVKNVPALYGGMLLCRDQALFDYVRHALDQYPLEQSFRLTRQALLCWAGDVLTAPLVFQLLTFRLWRYDFVHGINAIGRFIRTEHELSSYEKMPARYLKRMTALQAELVLRQLEHVDDHARARMHRARLYHKGLADIAEVRRPPFRDDGSHIYLSYPVQVTERRQLVEHLFRRGRDVRAGQYANAADAACFANFARDCPTARATAAGCFVLPTYPRYSESEVMKNICAIREFYGRPAAT